MEQRGIRQLKLHKKEHPANFINSKLLAENQLQMEQSTLLMVPES
jgi:hypothetical protein